MCVCIHTHTYIQENILCIYMCVTIYTIKLEIYISSFVKIYFEWGQYYNIYLYFYVLIDTSKYIWKQINYLREIYFGRLILSLALSNRNMIPATLVIEHFLWYIRNLRYTYSNPFLILFFLLNILEGHWLTKLYKAQEHSSTTPHRYTVLYSEVYFGWRWNDIISFFTWNNDGNLINNNIHASSSNQNIYRPLGNQINDRFG